MRSKDDKSGEKFVYNFENLGLVAWLYYDSENPKSSYYVYFMNPAVMKSPVKFIYHVWNTGTDNTPFLRDGKVLLAYAIWSVIKDIDNGKMTFEKFCEEYEFEKSPTARRLWRGAVNDRKRMSKVIDVEILADDVLHKAWLIG